MHSDTFRAAKPNFGELDASRGMLALSHQHLQGLTPRDLYEARAGPESLPRSELPPPSQFQAQNIRSSDPPHNPYKARVRPKSLPRFEMPPPS